MALTELYTVNGATIGATEYSIPNGGTTLQSITTDYLLSLMVDGVANIAKGDRFAVKVYEKCLSGSTQRPVFEAHVYNAQAEPWVFPPLMLMHGWDATLKKIAGTDRALYASARGDNGTITQYDSVSALSVSATELSILSGTSTLQTDTTAGIYQLWIDPVAAAMAKGDEFEIRIYEKVNGTGGTKRQIFEASIHDVQDQLFVSPMFHLRTGWDMTIKKISGTDRSFDASIRKVG
jgi:hypothetical protein